MVSTVFNWLAEVEEWKQGRTEGWKEEGWKRRGLKPCLRGRYVYAIESKLPNDLRSAQTGSEHP